MNRFDIFEFLTQFSSVLKKSFRFISINALHYSYGLLVTFTGLLFILIDLLNSLGAYIKYLCEKYVEVPPEDIYSGFYIIDEEAVFGPFHTYVAFFYALLTGPTARNITYYSVFFISFSYAFNAPLSNEYLLFGCILFSMFVFYDKLRFMMSAALESSISNLRIQLQRKLLLTIEISAYEQIILERQSLLINCLEDFVVFISELDSELENHDDYTYENQLFKITANSLYNYYVLEASLEFEADFIYFNESFEEALEDLLTLAQDLTKFLISPFLKVLMFEIYNFFIFFVLSLLITLVLTFGFGQFNLQNFDYEKFSAYECGFDPFEHTRFSFDVRFYLIAIFYIIFDLEVIFFFPVTLTLTYFDSVQFVSLAVFIFFLFLGILYEFWFGKLDWSA